jgi:glutathione S-transferase
MGLEVLNDLLDGRDYLVSTRPTIADIAVFGVVAHMAEAKFDVTAWPQVKAWWDRIAALPGFRLPYDLLPRADKDAAA